jgi:hypothetical protein
MVVVASVALPFYASMGGVLGSFMAGLIFWALASIALAMQYFLPIRSARNAGFAQSLRLAFVVFVDGPFFSIALALWGLTCVVLSPLVAFLLPGPAAAVLAACEGSRLRLYKVDRLMASGGRPLGRCDWVGLLADDKEALGDRKLKDFLFPWKR